MRYSVTICDVCQKEIGLDDFKYIFYEWHYMRGKSIKLYMCENCFEKFKEFVNVGEQE